MMPRTRLLTLTALALLALRCAQDGSASPNALPSTIRIAPPDEPGERLVIEGRVFGRDGRPRGGVEVYAYQTDASGRYRTDRSRIDFERVFPRLGGRVVTAADGTFTIETIKPGVYPSRDAAAHVHFNLHPPGAPKQFGILEFEGDPLLPASELARSRADGEFGSVRPLTRDAHGVLHCTINLRLTA